MIFLKTIAYIIIIGYVIAIVVLYLLQKRLIFYPGRLSPDYKFSIANSAEELTLTTEDGARISGLFFPNSGENVILYFHGNAGDLSGWQFVSEDFTTLGFNFMIIDYRGYGKSTGSISEQGLYRDADAAYRYLIEKGFQPKNILIYGRSIGSGVAVDLASRKEARGLILESPFSSFAKLANEKFPFFFPSLYLRYRFDNIGKINTVQSPVMFLHGTDDTLIPSSHSQALFKRFNGTKKMILVEKGAHNDLHAFDQYKDFLRVGLVDFFKP
ncbi:MAG TPA: alpha/beta hydrolase [Chryseosolibacter sp.]|nr:alpha/beta hydrolase [Chryseosolibacter sp.]